MNANTITFEPVDADGWQEAAGVLALLNGQDPDTGDLGSSLGSLVGMASSALGSGGGGGGGAGGLGSTIGGVAGGAIGSAFGPAGTAIGSGLGSVIGSIGEAIFGKKTRPLTPQENARLEEAKRKGRAGDPFAFQQAFMSVYRPAAYAAMRDSGVFQRQDQLLATWRARAAAEAKAKATKPAPKPAAPKPPAPKRRAVHIALMPQTPKTPQTQPGNENLALLSEYAAELDPAQRARLYDGIRAKRGAETLRQIQAETSADLAPPDLAPPDVYPPDADVSDMVADIYDDTAAPPAPRPRPAQHISLIPLRQHQLATMLRLVPTMRRLDVRLLRLLSGRSAAVRDTAGIEPGSRTYHATRGETPAGIAKKLTGNADRAADLTAANPGHQAEDPIWNIPPGWMHFVRIDDDQEEADTGAPGAARSYVVVHNDTPIGIATKTGAKATHPKWWSELKQANPQIPTRDGGANFARFNAGDVLSIPDSWPPSDLYVGAIPSSPTSPFPTSPLTTGPANSTMDAGVLVAAHSMLATWNVQHPGACNPPDFGQGIMDFAGLTSTRSTSALASFQFWANRTTPGALPLRMDGVLDDATNRALFAATAGAMPIPGPGAVPNPKPSAPPGLPAPGGVIPAAFPFPAQPFPGQPFPSLPPGFPGGATPLPGGGGGQLPPGAIPGAQVPGFPPGVVFAPPQGPGAGVPSSPFSQPFQVLPVAPPPAAEKSASGGGALPLLGLFAAGLSLL